MKHPIFVQPVEVIEAYAATIREVLADPERIMETVGVAADPRLTVDAGGHRHEAAAHNWPASGRRSTVARRPSRARDAPCR